MKVECEMKFVLVGGCPSSGSTLLSLMLDSHPEIYCGPELNVFSHPGLWDGRRSVEDIVRMGKEVHPLAYGVTWARIPPVALQYNQRTMNELQEAAGTLKDVNELVRFLFEPRCKMENKRMVCEKSPPNVFAVLTALERNPDLRVILTVRNVVDVVDSLGRRGCHGPISNIRWLSHTAFALEAQKRFPGRTYLLRYEDMLEDTFRVLGEICFFLGVEAGANIDRMVARTHTLRCNEDPTVQETSNAVKAWTLSPKDGIPSEWKSRRTERTKDEKSYLNHLFIAKNALEPFGYRNPALNARTLSAGLGYTVEWETALKHRRKYIFRTLHNRLDHFCSQLYSEKTNRMFGCETGKDEVHQTKASASEKICMFVYNNMTNDSRVEKEAEALVEAGRHVTVIALASPGLPAKETRNGYTIRRLSKIRRKSKVSFSKIINKLKRKTFKVIRKRWKFLVIFVTTGLFLLRRQAFEIWQILANISMLFTPYLIVCLALLIVYRVLRKKRLAVCSEFKRAFGFLSFYSVCKKEMGGVRYDVYLAHDLNTLPIAYSLSKKHGARLVYDSHELYTERNKVFPMPQLHRLSRRCVERWLIRKCDAVITVNESIAEWLAETYSIPKPHVIMNLPVVGTGGASSTRDLHLEARIPLDQKIILYTGSLTYNRGLEELIEAVSTLECVTLVLMGPHQERQKKTLSKLARNNGLDLKRFRIFGPVAKEDVVAYSRGAFLGVAPIQNACKSYYYCLPNKLFEYMSAGLPVIASDFPEMRKIVLGEKIGMVFDAESVSALRQSICMMLENDAMYQEMKTRALIAAKTYAWEPEKAKFIQLFTRNRAEAVT